MLISFLTYTRLAGPASTYLSHPEACSTVIYLCHGQVFSKNKTGYKAESFSPIAGSKHFSQVQHAETEIQGLMDRFYLVMQCKRSKEPVSRQFITS
jgi:hypothetical protein